jgi:hypothetical protein
MTGYKRRYSLFPKLMSQVVEPLTKPLFKSRGLAGTNFVADWPRIVGKELAGHCWPEKISFPQGKKTGGTLCVACENGFATEIQHMQPMILERLNVFYGYQAVSRLAISHSAKRATPKKAVAKQPPRAQVNPAAVSNIDDPELKQALQSLANTLSGK